MPRATKGAKGRGASVRGRERQFTPDLAEGSNLATEAHSDAGSAEDSVVTMPLAMWVRASIHHPCFTCHLHFVALTLPIRQPHRTCEPDAPAPP